MIGFVALIGAYATTGQIIPVFSNELLEDRRANEWQTCHDGFACNAVNYGFTGWIIGHFLMKINTQFTIQKRYKLMTPEAERFNGWAAMLGFVAAVGAYATTGNIIPGIF